MPKVSVIIPVFRVENYIEKCARSLFEQTLDDIEYIFIDDCTPDSSVSIIRQVLNDYPNRMEQVRVLRMTENSGQAIVRERGIKEVTGEYTIHCDGDDWVDSNMYESMYNMAIDESAEIVICDFTITDGKHCYQKRSCYNTEKDEFLRDLLSMRSSWSLCNKLVRTDLLKNGIVLPQNNMGEDMAIIIQVALKANIFSYIPKGYYYYFNNSESITRIKGNVSIWNRFLQVYNNSMIVLDVLKKYDLLNKYKWPLCVLKLNVKRQAYLILFDKAHAQMWVEVFPDLIINIWFCSYISLKDKIKYLIYCLRARV